MRRCNSPGAHGGALPPVQNGAVQNGTLTHSERDAAAQESSDSLVSRAVESPQAVVGAAVPAARVGCVDTSWRQHAVAATACLSRSEEHTSELQSLMRISYAVFCLKKKNYNSIYTQSDLNIIRSKKLPIH